MGVGSERATSLLVSPCMPHLMRKIHHSGSPTPGSEADCRLPVGSERAPLPMLQAGSRCRSDSSCRLPGLSVWYALGPGESLHQLVASQCQIKPRRD